MIIKIFSGPLNYDVKTLYTKDDNEFIIGVDQGCEVLIDNNITIDLALGDFDSLNEELLHQINQKAEEVRTFNKVKNSTDTYMAIKEALKMDYDEIVIYGGLGNRVDHSIANIMLLKLGIIVIVNNTTKMFMLNPGTYSIENEYKYISFFANEDVTNLSLEGFKYELQNITLLEEDPLCISNEGSGTITFDEGVLLVIQTNE